jgi:hypothetical protein
MHVELPKAKKWKEFSGEYVMIVISIITALGLEHAVQTYHHHHLAQVATERIEAELRANQNALDRSLKHNLEMHARVDKLYSALRAELKQGTPDQAAIDKLLEQDKEAIVLSVRFPGVQHEAWDVAVANQAASWIDPDKLQNFAALYAHMRDIDTISNGAGNRFLDGPQWADMYADIQVGKVPARDLYHMLHQMTQAYGSMDGNLQGLRDDFAKRLGELKSEAQTAQR